MISTLGLLSLALSGVITAHPLDKPTITPLSPAEVNGFNPYTYFASAAYSPPGKIKTWSCGAACKNNTGFVPTATGGNGDTIQFWYVGYSPSLSSVVVAHEGTDFSKIGSILTDANILLKHLDPTLFSGISSSILVHGGFADVQAETATSILSAVQSAISAHGATKVTIVGHSLGGALALLDSIYLPLHLPSHISFRTITYGMPRVGNRAFANYVDAHLDLTHINNKKDIVPIIPARSLGYQHPAGEIHIDEQGLWEVCPGQENPSPLCIDGAVPNIFDGNLADHSGPYNGITM